MRALTLALCLLLGVLIAQMPGAASAKAAPNGPIAHHAMTMGAEMIGAMEAPCPACNAMGSTSPTGSCHADNAPCASASACGALAMLGAAPSRSPRHGGIMQRPALMTVAAQSACVPEPPPPRI